MEDSTNNKGTLDRLRDSKNIREKYHKFLEKNYKLPSSISLVSNIIKNQNIYLLNWISKEKGLNEKEKQELFNKFLKVNYYCPDIISDKKFNLRINKK